MVTQISTDQCGTLQPIFNDKVDLCRDWVESVLGTVERYDDVYGTRFDEVENRSRDGFIPYTDGGFDGVAYATLSYAHGSGAAPAVIQPYLDEALKDIESTWNEKNPEHTVAWCYDSRDEDQLALPGIALSREREHWQEKFYEFEDSSLSEGGTYFYKVRVLFHGAEHKSLSGEPEAFFMVGVNTDFEYGRDYIAWLSCYGSNPQCTEWVWEKTVKISDLDRALIKTLVDEATTALAGA